MKLKKFLLVLTLAFLAAGCNPFSSQPPEQNPHTNVSPEAESMSEAGKDKDDDDDDVEKQIFEFATLNPIHKFSASLEQEWKVEYIPTIQSINIYDRASPGANTLEKSQIFIRSFQGNKFLTLSTVDILKREETLIHGHEAVAYEIQKKTGVPNFQNQPAWRNTKHNLIDIRFSKNNPSTFFVFAYSPKLDTKQFNTFIDSLIFHNDKQSFVQPLDKANKRITKKPFGLLVSPTNSPVSPERFSGYHNASDYEILPGEENNIEVKVTAICGGKLLRKQVSSGYRGLLVQECQIGNSEVTIIYGHIKLSSVTAKVGDYLTPGLNLAVLGGGNTAETDNERKHLHLGIHTGANIDIRGYVNTQKELTNWLNPEDFLKYK